MIDPFTYSAALTQAIKSLEEIQLYFAQTGVAQSTIDHILVTITELHQEHTTLLTRNRPP